MTTPTPASVRRALAIQLVINREWGLAANENPLQGSFVIEQLTDLVEEAVLAELERLSERGGVLGAMETGYQRGRIQDDSMLYEQRKHDGTLPIIGVNTFVNPEGGDPPGHLELARSSEEEKRGNSTVSASSRPVTARAAGRPRRPPAGGAFERERLRGADAGRPQRIAGRDQCGVVRGRRLLPARECRRRAAVALRAQVVLRRSLR